MPNCAAHNTWYVYILRCADNSLYTGITTDIVRRVQEHNSAASVTRYTRARQPLTLVYHEIHADRASAARREHALKQLRKAQKEALLASFSKQDTA